MELTFYLIGFLYLPALLVCGALYGAGRMATHLRLGKVLRVSAIVWLIGLWAIFTLFAVAEATCTNGFILNYRDCTVLLEPIADLAALLTLLGVIAGIAYAGLLVLIGVIVEVSHRRAGKS